MALAPAPLIAAPEPGPRRYGLLTVASGPIDLPARAEGLGVRYVPVVCGGSYALTVDCPAPDDDFPGPDGDNGQVETGGFLVRSVIECTQVGQIEAELRTKVTRRLEASEQGTAERAFATGLDHDGGPLGILNLDELAEPVTEPYDPADLRSVVGALLQEAAAGYAGRVTLHAPASAEPYVTDAGLVVADGPFLRTPTGAAWSFGNYPTGEIFASGQTTVWRSPSPAAYSVFDTTNNLRLIVAERAYAIGVDCGWAVRADFTPLGS